MKQTKTMSQSTTSTAVKNISLKKVVLGSVLGFCLLTLLTLVIRQFKNEPAQADQKIISERLERLHKLREEEHAAVTGYKWEDQAAGVVRIPVEKALGLTLSELKNKPIRPSSMPVQLIPAPAAASPAENKKGS
jgi:hypothetical protein